MKWYGNTSTLLLQYNVNIPCACAVPDVGALVGFGGGGGGCSPEVLGYNDNKR